MTVEVNTIMQNVKPYLMVNGAPQWAEFIKAALGAEETMRYLRPDGLVMHGELQIGDALIEFADANENYPFKTASLHHYVPDVDATYKRALALGAQSINAPRDQPYGDRECGIRDIAGHVWWIAAHKGASYIPAGLRAVTPYLTIQHARDLKSLLEACCDAQTLDIHEASNGSIQHATLKIGDSAIELSEAHDGYGPWPFMLHIYVDDVDKAYRKAIAAGATGDRAPADQDYGERSAGVIAPNGVKLYFAKEIAAAIPT